MASGGARSVSPSTLGNHSFCKSCLASSVESPSVSGSSCCPACRKTFVVPEKGIDGIPKRFVLSTQRDSMQKAAIPELVLQHVDAERIAVTWKDCVNTERDQDHGKATKFCKECAEYYCKQCAEGHDNFRATRQHKLFAAEEVCEEDTLLAAALVNVPKCEEHPKEDFTLFCCTCNLPICTMCFLSTHKSHDVKELAVVAKEFKSDMDAAIRSTDHSFCKLVSEVEDLNSTALTIEKDMRGARKQVEKASDEMHKVIDRHQKALQDRIHQLEIDARGQVNAAREERQHVIEKMQNQRSLANSLNTMYDQALHAPGVRDQLFALSKATLSTKCVTWKSEISRPSFVNIPTNIVGEVTMKKPDDCQPNLTKMEPVLPPVAQVNLEATVTGIATSKNYLYITQYNYPELLVFTLPGEYVTAIPIPGLGEPVGLAVMIKDDNMIVIIISDNQKKLYFGSVSEATCNRISHKYVRLKYRPRGVSVFETTGDFKAIVAAPDQRKIMIYTTSGQLLKEIHLAANGSPSQLVYGEQSKGGYLITDCKRQEIAVVNEEGTTIKAYTSSPKKLINVWHAVQDRYGNVLVAEMRTNLVHWLSPDLTFQRYLLKHQTGIYQPRKLCLQEDQGFLYVSQGAEENSFLQVYRYSYANKARQSPTLDFKQSMNKMQAKK